MPSLLLLFTQKNMLKPLFSVIFYNKKYFSKKYKKGIDKRVFICYNIKRRRDAAQQFNAGVAQWQSS